MTYNLHNQLDVQSARARLEFLIGKGSFIELAEKKPKRSIQQNRYLYCILNYFACQVGESVDYVKRYYYKYHCNKDIFLRTKVDKITNQQTTYLRSSAELDSKEMTDSIERFRNFSMLEAGIYIPSPDEPDSIMQMQIEIERNKQFI